MRNPPAPLFSEGDTGAQLDIRFPAPVAPGSESSRLGARALTMKQLQAEQVAVLRWYVAQSEPRTRHECAADLYAGKDSGLGSACGRINVLVTLGYLEEVGMQGRRATVRATTKGCLVFAEAA